MNCEPSRSIFGFQTPEIPGLLSSAHLGTIPVGALLGSALPSPGAAGAGQGKLQSGISPEGGVQCTQEEPPRVRSQNRLIPGPG